MFVYQKKDGEDKKLKNGDAKVGSGRTIPLKQVQEDCFSRSVSSSYSLVKVKGIMPLQSVLGCSSRSLNL